ncbi:MAG: metallophosphatase domain-containing protein [Planctomycetes bacterium]|nr:metallophosphatase domain-containing protein [Planctomycetota bacterium]
MSPPPTRIVCISDTHNHHSAVRLPPGDVLVHAGDVSGMGRPHEIESFSAWLGAQPFAHKVVIAGNHDWLFERDPAQAREILSKGCPGVVYLQDSGVEIRGLKFWGSPWQPEFCGWAFNIVRREDLAKKWALIPADTDVLLTHGPPRGILDRTMSGDEVGCDALAAEVGSRVRPRLHVFGHIHEAYGMVERGGVTHVNASICTLAYRPTNRPVVREL